MDLDLWASLAPAGHPTRSSPKSPVSALHQSNSKQRPEMSRSSMFLCRRGRPRAEKAAGISRRNSAHSPGNQGRLAADVRNLSHPDCCQWFLTWRKWLFLWCGIPHMPCSLMSKLQTELLVHTRAGLQTHVPKMARFLRISARSAPQLLRGSSGASSGEQKAQERQSIGWDG